MRRRPGGLFQTLAVRRGRVHVVVLFVMLTQQVLAVVVAVWRSHQGMDVVARRLIVVDRDAALVVELDQDHRAVDAVIERAGRIAVSHPGEPGLVQMRRHFVEADIGMAGAGASDIDVDQIAQQGLLVLG